MISKYDKKIIHNIKAIYNLNNIKSLVKKLSF